MPAVRMTKHHGLGNDFLVVFTDQSLPRLGWDVLARQVCDRRHGVGADGLLVATPADGTSLPGGADLTMRLHNADGSAAEMSGNGVRCLVQAWARRTGQDEGKVVVATAAGPRAVSFVPGSDPHSMMATVDMGAVTAIEAPEGWPEAAAHNLRPVAHLNVGNPHTVVAVDDVGTVDLEGVGRKVPEVNLEVVEPGPEPGAVTMRVHERGAGITEACGTGACAAAWAAAGWGLVRAGTTEITVHMDGGDARVRLNLPEPGRVTLIGPTTFVGTVEVEL